MGIQVIMNHMVLYRRKVKAFFVTLVDTLFEMVKRALGEGIGQLMAA